jgi:hypothetical protein
MGKTGKVFVFILICLVILVVLTVIKAAGGGTVLWLGAFAIPIIYMSMFGKKNDETINKKEDNTLNK